MLPLQGCHHTHSSWRHTDKCPVPTFLCLTLGFPFAKSNTNAHSNPGEPGSEALPLTSRGTRMVTCLKFYEAFLSCLLLLPGRLCSAAVLGGSCSSAAE